MRTNKIEIGFIDTDISVIHGRAFSTFNFKKGVMFTQYWGY